VKGIAEALSTLQVLIHGSRSRKEKEIAYLRPWEKADNIVADVALFSLM